MGKYIQECVRIRQSGTSEAQRNLAKLMMNAVFGKSMQQVRGRASYKIVSSEEKFKKSVNNPTFKRTVRLDNDIHLVEKSTPSVLLNQPIFVGQAVLDLSKVHMFAFWYDTLIPEFGRENIKLLGSDTDSVFFEVTGNKNVYDNITGNLAPQMDLANYPPEMGQDKTNDTLLGFFKDELACNPRKNLPMRMITEFVGLRAKVYAFESCELDTGKSCSTKKVLKGLKPNGIEFENYKRALFSGVEQYAINHGIRSFKRQNRLIKQKKKSLSSVYDKRIVCENLIDTHAYGYNPVK
jgi:hypothetical protein